MARLRGTYEGSVDAKGRLSIPAKYRKLLPEELVIAKHPDKDLPGLVVYPEEDFDSWFDSVLESKGGAKANSSLQSKLLEELYMDSQEASPDGIGRITIQSFLRKYAGIERDVVITGVRDHLVIRAPEVVEKVRESFASNTIYDDDAASDTTE